MKTPSQTLPSPTQTATKKVHDLLIRQLSETYPDSLKVKAVHDAESGLIGYEFGDTNYQCFSHITPFSERSASIGLEARIGRLYCEFRRALRWMSLNRAGNTLALFVSEDNLHNKELWLNANRITAVDDVEGVREMLVDFHQELLRVQCCFEPYFSHLLRGQTLAFLESDESDSTQAILSNPQEFIRWAKENENADELFHVSLIVSACAWTCDWAEQLKWAERALKDCSERSKEEIEWLLTQKALALHKLQRPQELLALVDELWSKADDAARKEKLIAGKLAALCGLGQFEHALELVRSAEWDINPRVNYYRALAHAKLGQVEQAIEDFREYETQVGRDSIGQKRLREALSEAISLE